MDSKVLKKVEGKYYKNLPNVNVGDTVELHLKIKEGNKERSQVFKGIVISIRGVGLSKNIVVRKISYGVGVEKIVPLHSPELEKIKVVKKGNTRRAKLYYMRERVGKKAMKVKAGSEREIWIEGTEEAEGEEKVEEVKNEETKKEKEETKEKKDK